VSCSLSKQERTRDNILSGNQDERRTLRLMACSMLTGAAPVGLLGPSVMTLGLVKTATLIKAVQRRGRVDDLFALLTGLFVHLENDWDRQHAEGSELDYKDKVAIGWAVSYIGKASGTTCPVGIAISGI